jgi:hypothetical protein
MRMTQLSSFDAIDQLDEVEEIDEIDRTNSQPLSEPPTSNAPRLIPFKSKRPQLCGPLSSAGFA